MKRLLLLLKSESYKADDFLNAAEKVGVDLVIGTDHPQGMISIIPENFINLNFVNVEDSTRKVVLFHRKNPLDAIVAVEDEFTTLAARASSALGLPTNPEEAVVAARDKHVFREITAEAGLDTPWFRKYHLSEDPSRIAGEVPYPCVLKPTFLSASRGVIRADDPGQFCEAFTRIKVLLEKPEIRELGGRAAEYLLVESFIPGSEISLDGMMSEEGFHLLAFFDKPDPLDGPYFEETLFITPSRHSDNAQKKAIALVEKAACALGLRRGPVHGEIRIREEIPHLIEIAPRSIGGRCSRILRFGSGMSLEEIIIRQALGISELPAQRENAAVGVMMIPIPGEGILAEVNGLEQARQVPGIKEIDITIPLSQMVVPPPEGNRYLGFIFAKRETPEEVEGALREAHRLLGFTIKGV